VDDNREAEGGRRPVELRGDCSRCAALCCVGLSFERSEHFAFDKPAGAPCAHLGANHRCQIHQSLTISGFEGCARYDCLGAGQRVTQEVFAGRSWREDPQLLLPMLEAFVVQREIQELLLLVHAAAGLSLTPQQASERAELERTLSPDRAWSLAMQAEFQRAGTAASVRRFVASLRGRVSRGASDARRLGNASGSLRRDRRG
jgi:hypothetical protein